MRPTGKLTPCYRGEFGPAARPPATGSLRTVTTTDGTHSTPLSALEVKVRPGYGAHCRAAGPAVGSPPDNAAVLRRAGAAAVALDPRLLEPLRTRYRSWQERLEADGIEAAAATIVRLAVDGWWFAILLGLDPLRAGLHRDVRRHLEALTHRTQQSR